MRSRTTLKPGFGPRPKTTPPAPLRPPGDDSVTASDQKPSDQREPAPRAPSPKPLVPGSVTAKALARVWRGGEMTIIDSPPGAGKTELVATLVAHLATRAGMRILVGTPTKAQAVSLVHRVTEQVTPKFVECAVKGAEHLTPKQPNAQPKVIIATLAKIKFLTKGGFDLLVVDEAYQATHAMFSAAADGVPQAVLVGDPGQIGPVVTIDTSIWSGQKDAPHLQAPMVTSDYEDVERFSLGVTWRLGPISAAAVAPLYDFQFTSADIPRQCVTTSGEILDEIDSIGLPHADKADDLDLLASVADRTASLVGAVLAHPEGTSMATSSDVAVVCSRNSQVSILTGMLRQRGLTDVVVGTADRLQGGQWPIVVSIDPFIGAAGDSEYNASVGRLCVMASRHTHHLSWVHDDSWIELTNGHTATDRKNRAVREALTANPIVQHVKESV